MEVVTLSTPVEERDPDVWVVLGSGPNREGWNVWAEQHKANVICCNGSVLLCKNPSAYLSVDKIASKAFKKIVPKNIPRFIGRVSIEKIKPDYKINDKRVRTSAVWSTYLAIHVFKAKTVHLFGVHGSYDKKWDSVSFIDGSFTSREGYDEALQKRSKELHEEPKNVVLLYQNSPEDSNINTAEHIQHLRETNLGVAIELHGGGPISDILKERGARYA